jgi:hypothetical protein
MAGHEPTDIINHIYRCHLPAPEPRVSGGAYIPGRDYSPIIDWIGWLAVAGTLVGVLVHGGLRVVSAQRRDDTPEEE